MSNLDDYIAQAQGVNLESRGLYGKISDFGSSIANSSVGKMASGLGEYMLDTAASGLSDVYKQKLLLQQELEAEEELRRRGSVYSDKLYGTEGTSTPYDEITQELVPGIGMNEQPGTGLKGGQMTIADFLIKQQSNPNKLIGTTASAIMRDRMDPIEARANPNAKFRDYMGMSPEMQKANDKYRGDSPLVQVINGEPTGRWATDEESKALGVAPNKRLWMGPNGPKMISSKSEAQEASGIVAKSLIKRMELMDSVLGKDYLPKIQDNLNQFGVPDAMNNLVRSDKGRKYIAGYTNMVADVVKELTGLASTDSEYQRLYKTMAFVPGDELPDMQLKRQTFNIRVDDLLARSGIDRPAAQGTKPVSEMTLEEINAELGE